ncbi:MAG: minichromosome maintenance protein MCM [Candidatus Parvarchaeota archaeon]|nr:minichromosome maintenance protein MCM [Candidatus Rehaiarchaeum fermentans]
MNEKTDEMLNEIKEFSEEFVINLYKKKFTQGSRSVVIDFDLIDKFSPELGNYILSNPTEAISSFKVVLEEIDDVFKDVNIRFYNIPKNNQVRIKDIRNKHIGKLIQIVGLIRAASTVKPVTEVVVFECQNCERQIPVVQKERTIKPPLVCPSCGKSKFRIASKKFTDMQRLIVEEAPEELRGGEQPEHIEVLLKDDLVDPKFERNIIPGNKVTISGIIKESPIFYGNGKQSTTSDLILEASYIQAVEQGYEDIEITESDKNEIIKLASSPDILDRLVASIAPHVYGLEEIKKAIALQLFGGVRKVANGVAIRGDIHILLVGDPGTAKSSILKYVAELSPKGRYVTGMGSSAAGLTATVVKDEISKGYMLEAGAMPLTNKGLLCVDEIDKMNKNDRIALHEGLEQQTITISKANIHATLIAQTAVLAAANPKLGRFNFVESVASQLDLPPTLINRFDLIFALKDIPNQVTDLLIANRIIESNKDITKASPAINIDLLRKYIAYARQNVNPVISEEAGERIKNFFISLRKQSTYGDNVIIPISARQLESIIRLAEASARIRLSNKVEVQDAELAISLITSYLNQLGFDMSSGKIDIDKITSTITSSERSSILEVKKIIKKLSDMGGASVSDIIKEGEKLNIPKEKIEEAIETLKKQGDIYEEKYGVYKAL